MKTASRSPSVKQIAEQEGWSNTGKQALFQEGYEYHRRIVIEMENVIKILKNEMKRLQRDLETIRGQRAIDNLNREVEEEWECESETDLVQSEIRRPLTPVDSEDPVRQLQFNTPKRSDEQNIQVKLLELKLTNVVRKQVGFKRSGEDHCAYTDRIIKASTQAGLGSEAITRLVHTCTGHAISAEALEKVRSLTGVEDKYTQWIDMLINANKDQVPLLSVWLSIEDEIPMSDKVRLLRDVGRKIPGGYKLVTILNTVTKKQIEKKLAEYDLNTQFIKRKEHQPKRVQKQQKPKVEKQQIIQTNNARPYNTRFQARQGEINKFCGPKISNQKTITWQRNNSATDKYKNDRKNNTSKTSYIPEEKWGKMTPEQKSQVIQKRKTTNTSVKRFGRNKLIPREEIQSISEKKQTTEKTEKSEKPKQ